MITEESRPAIDLAIYKDRFSAGDIHAYLTWLIHSGSPCIVLVPSNIEISHERVIPCVVPLKSAWLWDEATGDGTHVARASMLFACNLGLNQWNPSDVLKVTTVIRDLLGDLILMPPMPSYATSVVAEAVITDNATGKVIEKEITDYAE